MMLGQEHRPLLAAAICEVLRLRSRPNIFRLVSEDTTLKLGSGYKGKLKDHVELEKGDWVWLFPRLYLHYDPDTHREPEKFMPFERFTAGSNGCPIKPGASGKNVSCPFRNGNPALRVFGGGTAPCPGKDYAAVMLKAAIDRILLSTDDNSFTIALAEPEAPLPDAITAAVASTPPPSQEIYIVVK
jgi:cytochrome P450